MTLHRALPAVFLALSLACGGTGGGTDVGPGDPGPADAGDVPSDPGPRDEGVPDTAAPDVSPDTAPDVPADLPADVATDAAGDLATDAAADLPGDTGPALRTTVLLDRARIGSNGAEANFQHADSTFTKGAAAAQVRLVMDLDTSCYPFEKWATNPPPQGQNYPADCDAFDRNFEFTVDEPAAEGEAPATEWVRAITPFGGPMHVDVDVTDLYNGLAAGDHDAHVRISTWSDGAGLISGSNGGWWISARLEVLPGDAPRKVLAVIPLWNGSLGAGDPPAPIPFTVPEGVTAGRIEYRATGHGGATGDADCFGPAEEFCKRNQALKVDDAVAGQQVLLSDCSKNCVPTQYGQPGNGFVYCLLNPTANTMSAIADRANWCPSQVTPPWVVEGGALAVPGAHTFAFAVANVAAGGVWRISAVYVGTGAP
jgi:hypothetical protein